MAGPSWTDLDVLGRRNNKIIKYMETLLFKVKKDDSDTIVHYATAIGNLTRQNIEIIKIVDLYDEIKAKHLEDTKELRQQEAISRKWKSEETQRKKESLQIEMEREKRSVELEEEMRLDKIKFDAKNAKYDREQREKRELEL